MLECATAASGWGKSIYSTYVLRPFPTGLKLFPAKRLIMVRSDEGKVPGFPEKNDSEEHIAAHGGEALNQTVMLQR